MNTQQQPINRESDPRSVRTARIFRSIGRVMFLFGILLAALGMWLYTNQPQAVAAEGDQTTLVVLILAAIFLFDGIVFTVMARKTRRTIERDHDGYNPAKLRQPPGPGHGR